MSLAIVVKDEAAADLRQAISWYEAQRRDLGEEMLTFVAETLSAFAKTRTDTRFFTDKYEGRWCIASRTRCSMWSSRIASW
jgi:hypothetical protein